ncbi:MAG: zinc-ribbon domain-containing protein [Chloroflexota bacterium]
MTEILTESFCERCGTRYTFESATGGQRRLGGLKVLGLGLKNFVMSDGSSIDEAMAAARSESERHITNHQLDAFHRTFNFCMSCRQYTCANCWNAADAHCLTCSPLAVTEPALSLDEIDPARLLRYTGGLAPVADPASADDAAAPTIDEPAATALPAADEPGGVDGLTPGQSIDEALAAYEESHEVGAAAPYDTPVQAETPEQAAVGLVEAPETVETPELVEAPELVEPAAAPELVQAPEPVEPASVPEPVEDIEPEALPPAAAPGADTIVQPVWPSDPGRPSTPPQWPTGARWPTRMPTTRDASSGDAPPPKPTEPQVDHLAALISGRSSDAMWAASSQEILRPAPQASPAAVQACTNCGISLSATARFCRRCGTPQG